MRRQRQTGTDRDSPCFVPAVPVLSLLVPVLSLLVISNCDISDSRNSDSSDSSNSHSSYSSNGYSSDSSKSDMF